MTCAERALKVLVMAVLLAFGGAVSAGAWEPEASVEPDALTWLKKDGSKDYFKNMRRSRFKGTERFVRKLYNEGALNVTIARVKGELVGLRISLPLAPERRSALLALVNKTRKKCSGVIVPIRDTKQDEIVFWFC